MSSPSFPLPPPALPRHPPPPPLPPVFVPAGQDEAAPPLPHSSDEDEREQRRWIELNKRTERMSMSRRGEVVMLPLAGGADESRQPVDEISVGEGLMVLHSAERLQTSSKHSKGNKKKNPAT